MTTLREMDADLQAIHALMEHEDVDLESMVAGLEQLNIERNAKLKNIGLVCIDLRSDISVLDAEIKRLQAMKGRKTAKMDWLKGYALASMLAAEEASIKDPLVTLRVNAPRLRVEVTGEVEEEYYRHPEPVLDKTKITSDLKAGIDVQGADLVEGDPSLTIK